MKIPLVPGRGQSSHFQTFLNIIFTKILSWKYLFKSRKDKKFLPMWCLNFVSLMLSQLIWDKKSWFVIFFSDYFYTKEDVSCNKRFTTNFSILSVEKVIEYLPTGCSIWIVTKVNECCGYFFGVTLFSSDLCWKCYFWNILGHFPYF